MADFLSHKLIDFNRGASLPFHVSPHLRLYAACCLSSPKRRSSSLISRSNPNSSSSSLPLPIAIVSTTECLDGSLLFRFGDPSEIAAIEEDVNCTSVSDLDAHEGEGLDEELIEAGSVSKADYGESIIVSGEDAVLESNVGGIDIISMAELTVLDDDAIERDGFESAFVGVEEKETSAADYHEIHANQINDSITSPESDLATEGEIGDEFPSDLSGAESFVRPFLVDEGACDIMLPGERVDGDVASNEISDSGVEIEQTEAVTKREETFSPTLVIASGAASLTCSSQVLAGVEDAYCIAREKWFIVTSSVGEWSYKGMKPGLYAHDLVQNFQSLTLSCDSCKANVRGVLKQSAAKVQSPGLASALLAHFDNQVLHVVNIGDTGFTVIRNGAVCTSSSPINHEFNLPVQIGSSDDPLQIAEEHQVHLDDGDAIIMATDALFDNLYEKDIASIVSKSLHDNKTPKEIAELLATAAQDVGKSPSARCPFADEAQAAGYTGVTGGKLDHATVIVSLVKKQSGLQD